MRKSVNRLVNYGVATICAALFLSLLFSCGKTDRVPAGILDKGQMVSVLSELYISEQKISTLGVKRDSLKEMFSVMKDSIFEKTGVSDSVFRKSMNYYMEDPLVLEGIYAVLIDSLNLREQRVLSGEEKK